MPADRDGVWRRGGAGSPPIVLTGASLVLPDRVVQADLYIRGDVIRSIGEVTGDVAREAMRIDCSGCDILPGFVDLHTDNVERHLEPRPGIFFSAGHAVLSHDAELAAAGVTTALDAITIGGSFADGRRQQTSIRAIEALRRAREARLLRIDHALHLRCELSAEDLPAIAAIIEAPDAAGAASPVRIHVVSLMNHTPGQRQWRDLDKFHRHYSRRYGLSPEAIAELIVTRQRNDAAVAPGNRMYAAALAARTGACLASHDDTDPTDVDDAAACGCTLSEFPTTATAAARACARGLAVIAGAPNLVCGGSQSGNVAAADLARAGHLHVLASDYQPSSLLPGVYRLHRELEWPLPAAAATVSSTPARLIGFADRGALAPGCRADVIVVSQTDLGPVIRQTWAAGRRVF